MPIVGHNAGPVGVGGLYAPLQAQNISAPPFIPPDTSSVAPQTRKVLGDVLNVASLLVTTLAVTAGLIIARVPTVQAAPVKVAIQAEQQANRLPLLTTVGLPPGQQLSDSGLKTKYQIAGPQVYPQLVAPTPVAPAQPPGDQLFEGIPKTKYQIAGPQVYPQLVAPTAVAVGQPPGDQLFEGVFKAKYQPQVDIFPNLIVGMNYYTAGSWFDSAPVYKYAVSVDPQVNTLPVLHPVSVPTIPPGKQLSEGVAKLKYQIAGPQVYPQLVAPAAVSTVQPPGDQLFEGVPKAKYQIGFDQYPAPLPMLHPFVATALPPGQASFVQTPTAKSPPQVDIFPNLIVGMTYLNSIGWTDSAPIYKYTVNVDPAVNNLPVLHPVSAPAIPPGKGLFEGISKAKYQTGFDQYPAPLPVLHPVSVPAIPPGQTSFVQAPARKISVHADTYPNLVIQQSATGVTFTLSGVFGTGQVNSVTVTALGWVPVNAANTPNWVPIPTVWTFSSTTMTFSNPSYTFSGETYSSAWTPVNSANTPGWTTT